MTLISSSLQNPMAGLEAACPHAASLRATPELEGCSLAATETADQPSISNAGGAHQRVAGLVAARLERGGRLGRYTLNEVARHNSKDDGWVVVDGKVYDITHHVQAHPGWTTGCATSQLLAILRTLGTDCSEEVHMVHSRRALAQFQPYMIGVLVPGSQQQ